MTSRTHQASPDDLDDFGTRMERTRRSLDREVSSARREVELPAKLDHLGVLDELSAAYPACASSALASVDHLTKVLGHLGRAAHRSADRFRQADQPAQGPG